MISKMREEKDINIRKAEEKDFKEIGKIKYDNWQDIYRGIIDNRYLNNMTPEKCMEEIRNYAENPGAEIFIAENEKTVIGFVAGMPSMEILGAYQIEFLHVKKGYQRQGNGKKLIYHIGNKIYTDGYSNIVTDIYTGNAAAGKICEHLGAEFNRDFYQKLEDFDVPSVEFIWENMDIFK